MGGKSQVVGKNDVQSSSMGPGSSSSSRPSSNYGSRYQQALVSHKGYSCSFLFVSCKLPLLVKCLATRKMCFSVPLIFSCVAPEETR